MPYSREPITIGQTDTLGKWIAELNATVTKLNELFNANNEFQPQPGAILESPTISGATFTGSVTSSGQTLTDAQIFGSTLINPVISTPTMTSGVSTFLELNNATMSGVTSTDGVFTGAELNAVTISGSNIRDSQLDFGNTIANPTINGGNLNNVTVSGGTLQNNTINAPTVSGGILQSNTINEPTINGGNQSAPSITNPTISGGTLQSNTINAPTIDTPDITNGTQDSPSIDTPTISGGSATDLTLYDPVINGGLYDYTQSGRSGLVTASGNPYTVTHNLGTTSYTPFVTPAVQTSGFLGEWGVDNKVANSFDIWWTGSRSNVDFYWFIVQYAL